MGAASCCADQRSLASMTNSARCSSSCRALRCWPGRGMRNACLAGSARAAGGGTAGGRWAPRLRRRGSAPAPRLRARGPPRTPSAAAPLAGCRCWTARTSATSPAPCARLGQSHICSASAEHWCTATCSARTGLLTAVESSSQNNCQRLAPGWKQRALKTQGVCSSGLGGAQA